MFCTIFDVYLGHGFFHPVEGLSFSKSVFTGGLKLPISRNLRKRVVHLYRVIVTRSLRAFQRCVACTVRPSLVRSYSHSIDIRTYQVLTIGLGTGSVYTGSSNLLAVGIY